jgi:hypothetical protein
MWPSLALVFACFSEGVIPPFDPSKEIWQPTKGALHILDYPLGDTPIQSILEYQEPNSIHTLQLNNTSLNTPDIVFMTRSSSVDSLRFLSLKNNNVENLGLQYLAESNFIDNIVELDLESTGISSKGLSHLLQNPEFKPKKLNLSHNSFHSSVLNTLAKNKYIETIDLSNCKLTDGGTALFLSQTKARVVKLNQNLIGIPSRISPSIEELHLYQTRLDDELLNLLTKIEAKGLRKLFLGRVFISYDTLINISYAPWFANLEVLSFNPRKQNQEEREAFRKAYGNHRWLNLNDPSSLEKEKPLTPKEQ